MSPKKNYCKIISYQNGETDFEYNQKKLFDKLSDLEIVTFCGINTDGLLRTLFGTSRTPYIDNYHKIEPIKIEPIKRYINETFFVPLKKVRFKMGGVSFDKKFKEYKETLELTIPNYDIIEKFDAVKNYFANVLNTKKIQVTANIEITDNNVTSKEAKSPEIDKIDKQIIDSVKFEYAKSTKKKMNIVIEKNVFAIDEYFDMFKEEKVKSNALYNDYKELFEDILTISNTKHYLHLRFLSNNHCHKIMKLRYVLKPFSFIFLIEGDRNYHIIWETLDTKEATYIWHIIKDKNILKMTLRKIEDIINTIKVQGKTAYINSPEEPFKRIYHDYTSEKINDFIKWKGELESILT